MGKKEVSIADSYPLSWPAGIPRTDSMNRAKFKTYHDKAVDFLKREIGRLGGRNLIISTNLQVRVKDGLPYSQQGQIKDPGVAVYFDFDGEQRVLACDKWNLVMHNIHSIGLCISAIRGMERWGVSDMLKRVFTGFKQLPLTTASWWDVLGVPSYALESEVKAAYKKKAMELHPDRNPEGMEEMSRVNAAFTTAKKQLGFS